MNKKSMLHHKILGFDFGKKYIGIAFGQCITKTATAVTTISAKDGVPNWEEIQQIIAEWAADALVVGIPLHMDGTAQAITLQAQKFANSLQAKFNLPVYTVDERLSSWEAKKKLGIHYKEKILDKKVLAKINAMAAVILVEQWLAEH